MWEPLKAYFTSHSDIEKPGRVKNIFMSINGSFVKPWLLFLNSTLSVIDKFNI